MITKKVWLAASAALCLVTASATAFVVNHFQKDTPQAALVKSVAQESSVLPESEGEAAQLVDLVTIDNPFDESQGVAFSFSTMDDNKFASLSSMTSYDISDSANSLVELPADFSKIGTDLSAMESGQPITIVQKFNFAIDSTIAWETPEEASTVYVWAEHPETIDMKAGSQAIVTYTSNDGGIHWTGAVSVFNNDQV